MRITSASRCFPLVLLALAACTTAPPQPAPPPQPTAPAPTPSPVPEQPRGEWIDWPITPGSWLYRKDDGGSRALFGRSESDAIFTIQCDQSRRQIVLSRSGSVGDNAKMVLRASAGTQAYPAANSGGTRQYVSIALAPADIMLDRIAYSRGRFAVETSGLQSLAIPAWPEFSRVVEDCRS